ncbi:MAG: hypothetical protein EBR23_10100 [Planctomycetia bacterium]|nr:hypothetical protein [Planctomycetia bacterium]
MNGRDLGVPKFPTFDALESVLWPAAALLVFVVTAVLVDVMIILAARFRLVDLPNRRSAHALPTARGAGVAIAATASLAAIVVVVRWPGLWREILLGVILPSLAIGAVGIVDDTRPLRASLRLAIQIAVATAMTALLGPLPGIAIPGLPAWEFGWLGWPLTVLWIVGMINAFNFMDGADGMAALGAVVAGVLIAMLGFQTRSLGAMLLAAFVAAAAGGFLVFNWQPARVFMGDAGSGYLGTFLAAMPLLFNEPERGRSLLPIAMCLWPSIYDPLLSVLRRIWDGKNPLVPHREFLFHRLVRSGVSHARTSLLYGALAAIGGLAGLLMLNPEVPTSVQRLIPWSIIVLAALLTWLIERRCSRVPLVSSGDGAG